MSITNILNALTYLPNTIRIYKDWNTALAEWKRIGGFNASTGVLMNFLGDNTVHIIEYATWTKITWDDEVAQILKFVLIDHRETVIQVIDLVRQDKEPDTTELVNMAEAVSVSAQEVKGSAMTALYVLSTIFQILQYLKSQHTDKTDGDTQTIEANRPVLTFVKKIFGKR